MNTHQTETIRRLNDLLRTTFLTGRVLLTQGVMALDQADRDAILAKVRALDAFKDRARAKMQLMVALSVCYRIQHIGALTINWAR